MALAEHPISLPPGGRGLLLWALQDGWSEKHRLSDNHLVVMQWRGFQIWRNHKETITYWSVLLTWASLPQYEGLRTLLESHLSAPLHSDGQRGPRGPKKQRQSHWRTALWQMQVSAARKGRQITMWEGTWSLPARPAEQIVFVFHFSFLFKNSAGFPVFNIKFSTLTLKTKHLIKIVSSLLHLFTLSFQCPRTTWIFILVPAQCINLHFPSIDLTFSELF